MTNEPIIDLEGLLGPLADNAAEVASESAFFKLKDAFDQSQALVKEVEDKERMGGVDANNQPWRVIPEPDWDSVIEMGADFLKGSRDMRVAAWLMAGLLGKHQLQGLSAGLDVCLGLCEMYWAEIQPPPTPENGHFETTGGLRNVLSRKSFPSLWATTIVAGKKENDRNVVQYSYLDYRRTLDLERLPQDKQEEKLESGYITSEMYRSISLVTEPEFLRANLAMVDECIQKVSRLNTFLESNCLPDAENDDEPTNPDTREFREELMNLRTVMQQLVSALPGEESTSDGDSAGESGSGNSSGSKGQMTRESALRTIEQVASFFERSEPHSPLHFALRQVVRWGRMPYDKLLIELINDRSVMEQLRRQIGLPEEEESN